MDQTEKAAGDRITRLENEIKVIKNEIQAVLLDLRENTLNMGNPFSSGANPTAFQPIVIEQTMDKGPRVDRTPGDMPNTRTGTLEKALPVENQKPEINTREEEDVPVENVTVTRLEPECFQPEKARIPGPEPQIKFNKPPGPVVKKQPRLDLLTMASLTSWVEDTSKKIGKERTEAVLDISEAMGYLPRQVRSILDKLIVLAPPGPGAANVKTRDYMNSLMKLNGLLNKDNREETALFLLSLISGNTHHG